MPKDWGFRFDPQELRQRWERANPACMETTRRVEQDLAEELPKESLAPRTRATQTPEELRQVAIQSHVIVERPDELLVKLAQRLRTVFPEDRLSLISVWKPLCEQITLLSSQQNEAHRGPSSVSVKREIGLLLKELDLALSGFFRRKREQNL